MIGFAAGRIDHTIRGKVIDLGPAEVNADKKHRIAISDEPRLSPQSRAAAWPSPGRSAPR
ncbi:MAG: hypothetical protein K1X51_09120 [Rhodospirillaceae bacterium]|nr:hypothetical protein [Rhodospirillaceae bacterium]